jgi:hypothetical protein
LCDFRAFMLGRFVSTHQLHRQVVAQPAVVVHMLICRQTPEDDRHSKATGGSGA